MKKLATLFIVCFSFFNCYSQNHYWQQQVNYRIDVTLNDKERTLDAFEKLEYTNNSPDTLYFIWFHLWPNAYKNDKTAFSEQMLLNDNTSFYFSNKEERGYINRLDFKVNNITAATEDHPRYIDVIKLILPTPLPPGQTITITTPFHVKLPFNFSRGGYDGDSYQATQWYPKPAVYDAEGWHPMPYLDQGEFYSEFGNFDVRITLPENYVVAATGELQNEEEKAWLRTRKNFTWLPVTKRVKLKAGGTKKIVQLFPKSSAKTKTLQFLQTNVHDFAWFADKRFIVLQDTCRLQSGKTITIFTYYTPQESAVWSKSLSYCKDAVRFYSDNIGDYPYTTVSVVQGPKSFGGGMEYPTITIISPVASEKETDITIAHEIGHNWFYASLASNERKNPWMDEGINTFYENKYSQSKYGNTFTGEKVLFETKAVVKTDQPVETSSEQFSEANYNLVAYYKTSAWMRWLEKSMGEENFSKGMKDYFIKWQFKHPQPEDFKKIMQAHSTQQLDTAFSYLTKTGILPIQQRKGTSLVTIFQKEYFGKNWYSNLRNKNDLITLSGAFGYNTYDNFMIGGLITNYKLPPNNFQFLLVPLYATGSKKVTGISKLNYTFYPKGIFRKTDIFLNGSSFSDDKYVDSSGKKTFLGFRKLVPGIRFTIKEKSPLSSLHRFIQWKTYIINEDGLRFGRDTIINNNDTTISDFYKKTQANRTLNQLRIVIENNRALYPYNGELKIEQSKDFARAAFTGNYFFNYAESGGLNLRLFAGKFIYLGAKTSSKIFNTDRYHLNMTGATGYEDYTYSDYFIGRNEFDNFPSQQIMMHDGGFKVRTDLLASKVGKTDDWLIAANLTSTVPSKINPLSLLPVKIPLKVFADIGTYSDAWKQNSGLDHFLFDAGLQISVLKETINIYLPLLYSKVYNNYIKTVLPQKNRFLKTISFSIDISNFTTRKINKDLSF